MTLFSVLMMLCGMVGQGLSLRMPTPFLLASARQSSRRFIKAPTHLDNFTSTTERLFPINHSLAAPVPQKKPRRSWNDSFQLLNEYKAAHGDCRVPPTYADFSLAQWVATQRRRHEKLSNKHRKALDEIGFEWKRQISWEEMYDKLKEYRQNHGDCLVPVKWDEDHALAHWVANQRTRRSKLSKEQTAALDEIGFDWNLHETRWMEMYRKLERFKEAHGDCRVSVKRTKDAIFTGWVHRQRAMRVKGELRPDRLEKLNRVGFEWLGAAQTKNAKIALDAKTLDSSITSDEPWLAGYLKLVAYSREYGHCEIPSDYQEDPSLASWTRQQRQHRKNKSLKPIRKDLLDRIRFSWNPVNTRREQDGEGSM